MSTSTLSTLAASSLAGLREQWCRIHGPGPVTPGATTPTPDVAETLPGQHIHALTKLEGYDPQAHTPG